MGVLLTKKKWIFLHKYQFASIFLTLFITFATIGFYLYTQFLQRQIVLHTQAEKNFKNQLSITSHKLSDVQKSLKDLQSQDQYKINQQLMDEISQIHDSFVGAVDVYQKLTDLHTASSDTKNLDTLFAQALSQLSDKKYTDAETTIASLNGQIDQELAKMSAAAVPQVANAPVNNTPPGSGFNVQTVSTDRGNFAVSIVAADLNSTRVLVDTASDKDCSNNCPVLPLDAYVSRNGAFAGINGTFFCPTEYPSCAGKTNSFDTLLMNLHKYYFNSSNNVYSTVPLVYFTGNTMGVRGRSSDWGRDTGVDSVIAMQPLLISGGNIAYTDSSDTKFTNKGTRDFIAAKGSTVYIGVIYNANMSDAAVVLKALSVDNALNLDEGGSTALWYGGYKAGPGRNIPNAVLFVRK